MSSSLGTSLPARAGRQRTAMASMTPRQTQAYLLAREAIRRVQRVASLIGEAHGPARATHDGPPAGASGSPRVS